MSPQKTPRCTQTSTTEKEKIIMEAFNIVYPWIVLSVGLFDAAVFAFAGLGFGAVIITGRLDEIADRIGPATICVAIFNALFVGALAFTHWMLS
jgi:hypothetical protein